MYAYHRFTARVLTKIHSSNSVRAGIYFLQDRSVSEMKFKGALQVCHTGETDRSTQRRLVLRRRPQRQVTARGVARYRHAI